MIPQQPKDLPISRLKKLLSEQLSQGTSPRLLLLSISLGVAISVNPTPFLPIIVCVALAVILRLNVPLMVAVNYAVTPLQFLLLVPFVLAGGWFMGHPELPLSPESLPGMIRNEPGRVLSGAWFLLVLAQLGWLLTVPILWFLSWWVGRRFLKKAVA